MADGVGLWDSEEAMADGVRVGVQTVEVEYRYGAVDRADGDCVLDAASYTRINVWGWGISSWFRSRGRRRIIWNDLVD
jgi:hypothetical protein